MGFLYRRGNSHEMSLDWILKKIGEFNTDTTHLVEAANSAWKAADDARKALSDNKSYVEASAKNSREALEAVQNFVDRESNKRVVLIGDSYGLDTDMWTGWCTAFDNLMLYPCYSSAVGGSGFFGDPNVDSFIEQLESLRNEIDNPELITDIVVLGGYNDMSVGASLNTVTNLIRNFSNYARSEFVNATIHIGFIGVDYRNNGLQQRLNVYYDYYKEACRLCRVKFMHNARYLLTNKALLFFSDTDANSGFHPNSDGNVVVAKYLADYLENGNVDVKDAESFSGLSIYKHNGDCMVFSNVTNCPGGFPLAQGFYPFNQWVTVADLSVLSKLLWGKHDSSTCFQMSLPVYNTRCEYLTTCLFRIRDKVIEMNNLTLTGGLTIDGGDNGFCSISGFTIPFESNY